jgi:agmatinase
VDFGDIAPIPGTGAVEAMLRTTEAVATMIFEAGASLLTLGGDHTIPYGPVRGAAKRFGKVALIHLDAHQDNFDSDNPLLGGFINHGTFATGLVKEGCIDLSRSTQVYIRSYGPETPGGGYKIVYADEAMKMGPEKLAEMLKERVGDAPVYISFDLDALDAASAPGTGSPVPGGPTTGEVRRFLKALEGIQLVGADLVELNPLQDPGNVTAIAAAYFAVDLLFLLAARGSD